MKFVNSKLLFLFFDLTGSCTTACEIFSTGTASPYYKNSTRTIFDEEDLSCTCQCHPELPVFRDDLQICVSDIHGKETHELLSANRKAANLNLQFHVDLMEVEKKTRIGLYFLKRIDFSTRKSASEEKREKKCSHVDCTSSPALSLFAPELSFIGPRV